MRLQVGITDVEGATPVLRPVSMLVPLARALATPKTAATSTYPFVGGAEAEARGWGRAGARRASLRAMRSDARRTLGCLAALVALECRPPG
jgi:hypothetical protein